MSRVPGAGDVTHGDDVTYENHVTGSIDVSGPRSASVSERLGFADLVDRLAAEAPRRDTERVLFTDLRPELRARRIGAIRLPRADGGRLPLTEFFQFIRELAAADSNLAHSLRNHYASIENAIHLQAAGSRPLRGAWNAAAAQCLLLTVQAPPLADRLQRRGE